MKESRLLYFISIVPLVALFVNAVFVNYFRGVSLLSDVLYVSIIALFAVGFSVAVLFMAHQQDAVTKPTYCGFVSAVVRIVLLGMEAAKLFPGITSWLLLAYFIFPASIFLILILRKRKCKIDEEKEKYYTWSSFHNLSLVILAFVLQLYR